MTRRIAVHLVDERIACWDFSAANAARLGAALPGAAVEVCRSERELVRALADAEIAIVWRFDESWLASAPRLEWIVTPAAGRDYFRVAPRAGLAVDYGSFHGELMAETVVGFLLADARGIAASTRLLARTAWPREELAREMKALRGSTLTILGFGSIGRWIGRLAKPFGLRIFGVARTRLDEPEWFGPGDRVLPLAELDAALPATDYLALALPGGPETDCIIGAERLALLRPDAAIVNVGRGNAIDERALASALERGALRAAYLDVFAEEPLPDDSPLRRLPNAVLMPHASAIAPNYLDLFIDEFAERYRARYHESG